MAIAQWPTDRLALTRQLLWYARSHDGWGVSWADPPGGSVRLRLLEQAAPDQPHCHCPMPGSGGGWCLAPVKPSTLSDTRLLLPPAPRLVASDGAVRRATPTAALVGEYKRGDRRGQPRTRPPIPSHTRIPPRLTPAYTPPQACPVFPTFNEQLRGLITPLPSPAAMAVPKSLFASLAVALLALLSVAAVSPADAAVAVQAAPDPEALHIEGLSHADEEPALASLTVRSPYGVCKGYFQCGTKSVTVVAKNTYLCYYKEAQSRSTRSSSCNTLPYNCKPATCTGWRVCKCDQCKRVTFTFPIYCEQ